MKKVILVLAMVALTLGMNAQTIYPTSLQDKEFMWEEEDQGETFKVRLLAGELSVNISTKQLQTIVMIGVITAKYELKNTLSFRPIQVLVFESDGELAMTVKFLGRNAYGTEGLLISYFNVNLLEGEAEVEHLFTD